MMHTVFQLLSSLGTSSIEKRTFEFTICKSHEQQLGINICGGSGNRPGNPFNLDDEGIFICDIVPNSAVAIDGRLKPGMRIVEIDQISLLGMTYDYALEALERVEDVVEIIICDGYDLSQPQPYKEINEIFEESSEDSEFQDCEEEESNQLNSVPTVTSLNDKRPEEIISSVNVTITEELEVTPEENVDNLNHHPQHEQNQENGCVSSIPVLNVRTAKAERRQQERLHNKGVEELENENLTPAQQRALQAEKRAAWRKARLKSLEEDAMKAQLVIAKVREMTEGKAVEETNEMSAIDLSRN